jgi:hypothetical protein
MPSVVNALLQGVISFEGKCLLRTPYLSLFRENIEKSTVFSRAIFFRKVFDIFCSNLKYITTKQIMKPLYQYE